MRILLICALDVWSLDQGKGAPTLERTLRAYGEAGHHVDAVLPDIGANHFYDGRGCRRGRSRGRRSRTSRSTPFTCRACGTCRRVPGSRAPARRREGRPEAALRRGVPVARRDGGQSGVIARSEPFDVMYGYEVHGVLAARLVAAARLPAAARRALPGHRHASGADRPPAVLPPLRRGARRCRRPPTSTS